MRNEQEPRLRVACIDDDTLIREGARTLLDGLDVVGTYSRVDAFLAESPDVHVVLVDLWLRDVEDPAQVDAAYGMHGVRACASAGYRPLIYTSEQRRLVLAGCLAAGAHGIVHKSESLSNVVDAVRRVAAGEVVITTALVGLAEVVEQHGSLPALSPRQVEVLRLRARGETYRSIAARLYISPRTAEEYMGEVTRRFSDYLRSHSPADLERMLGIGENDLLGPRPRPGAV